MGTPAVVSTRDRTGALHPGSTRVRALPVDFSWRGRLLRRTQRLRAVRYVVVCHEVVSEIGGWWGTRFVVL